eukprot:8864801-Lingulodinium_polyedra.AAC.1
MDPGSAGPVACPETSAFWSFSNRATSSSCVQAGEAPQTAAAALLSSPTLMSSSTRAAAATFLSL